MTPVQKWSYNYLHLVSHIVVQKRSLYSVAEFNFLFSRSMSKKKKCGGSSGTRKRTVPVCASIVSLKHKHGFVVLCFVVVISPEHNVSRWFIYAYSPRHLVTKTTLSYRYRNPHYKPTTFWRPSQVYNGNPFTNKSLSSWWTEAQCCYTITMHSYGIAPLPVKLT